jgi:hypothetical protein
LRAQGKREAIKITADWMTANQDKVIASAKISLQEPFDYENEDKLLAAWDRRDYQVRFDVGFRSMLVFIGFPSDLHYWMFIAFRLKTEKRWLHVNVSGVPCDRVASGAWLGALLLREAAESRG